MGEVYKAKDTRLDRTVAIKVLPSHLSDNARLKERFEREARAVSSLNHPHICTLHDIGSENGIDFMVMEHIEGETLADRLKKGALPLDQALRHATEIADALDKAHRQGVVHRDLKPGNIMLTKSGAKLLDFGLAKLTGKVLDFGLAKAFADEVPEGELSASPTLSRDATRAGVILGTAAYMSPEQAKGKTVDKRTDIFSFGIVLYEMLTGKRAFAGEDVSEVLAGIIKMEPDWKAVPSNLDPCIQSLLRQCLEKDHKKRLRDIGDVRNEIDVILAEPAAAPAQAPLAVSAPSRARERVAWGLAILATLVAGITVWHLTERDAPAVSRLLIDPPGDVALGGIGRGNFVALSPDGRHLVYIADGQLYIRAMEQLGGVPLPGTDIPYHPFFSPDGRWVGFFSGGELKKVLHSGGNPLSVAEVPDNSYRGATWAPDDTIIFGQLRGGL